MLSTRLLKPAWRVLSLHAPATKVPLVLSLWCLWCCLPPATCPLIVQVDAAAEAKKTDATGEDDEDEEPEPAAAKAGPSNGKKAAAAKGERHGPWLEARAWGSLRKDTLAACCRGNGTGAAECEAAAVQQGCA